ncbi:f-box-like domain-containing protein [Sarocladium implicatum]|nr:f-box-like domain-containing protein [Sarocladium implicatum]
MAIDSMTTTYLVALPPEILHSILRLVHPADLIALPRVCRALHAFVKDNVTLYHDVYLQNLDTPPNAPAPVEWIKETEDVVKLEAVCNRKEAEDKSHELDFVYDTVTRLLKRASSAGELATNCTTHRASLNASLLAELFATQSNIDAFLERSFLFDRLRHDSRTAIKYDRGRTDEYQKSARLHCLYGRPILNIGRLRSKRTYAYACSKVYDLRQYTTNTRWGPFRDDGSNRVDWEKVEAIIITLAHNLHTKRLMTGDFKEVWDNPFLGSWANSFAAAATGDPKATPSSLAMQDPYGITGTWYRVVCFLDYNDFFSFNFPSADLTAEDAPRPPINVGEAVRLISMHLDVVSIEPPGPDDGQDLPVVHLKGVTRSLDDSWDDNANSETRGTVRLTKEGEVWWTLFSIFHGEERWRSECIQIGGPKSARGAVGNWFDRDYPPHGPAGPTSFWKISDEHLPRKSMRHFMPHHFILTYNHILHTAEDSDDDGQEEMEYVLGYDDEDDEDDDDSDMDQSELPGLLTDAQRDLEDVVPNHGQV